MEELKYSEEKKRCLARIGALSYTLGNYLPSECTWEFGFKDIIEIVRRNSKPFLGEDIKDISLGAYPMHIRDENGHKTTKNIAIAYVWLPKNSSHLIDTSTKDMDTAVKVIIPSPSKKLQEYAAKFSVDGKLNKVDGRSTGLEGKRRVQTGRAYTGIIVEVGKILTLEMDKNCHMYAREFGEEFRRSSELLIAETEFKELSPGDYTVVRMVVRKTEKKSTPKELRPRKSFNVM